MTSIRLGFLRVPALAALLVGGVIGPAAAGASDYRFEVVGPPVASDSGSVITVRLIGPSGQPVPNAEVFYRSLEQSSPKANFVFQRRVPLTPDGRGNYQFVTRRPFDSSQLRFGATVPGESGTLFAQHSVWGN